MSMELVTRSLDLDLDTLPTNSSKKKKIVQATGNKSAMSMIKTDRQKVWNELRKLQKKQRKDVIEKRKRQKTKSAIERYQEENAYDFTESSVEALKKLTDLGKVDKKIAEKILYKMPCRLSRDIKVDVPETADSIFTEEDFQTFEKEYKQKQKLKDDAFI